MWSLCFTRRRLNPLSSKILYHDSVRVIVSRFTSLIEDFVIRSYQFTIFSALGATVPARLLQGALVILILKQTSQFRSFGKWFLILCFLDFVTTFVGFSRSDSREMCADACNSVLSDFHSNPETSKEDVPAGLSNSSCHPSFYFGFGFLGIAPVSWMLVRHFALILNFKMNLKQVAPVP